ncbi:DUF5659 domain-containing protein [Chloroflexota bacterium]
METEIYETSDIALASYLLASGIPLLSLNRNNPRRAIFVFESPPPELVSTWQQGTATVNALAYYNSYQSLKSMVFRSER